MENWSVAIEDMASAAAAASRKLFKRYALKLEEELLSQDQILEEQFKFISAALSDPKLVNTGAMARLIFMLGVEINFFTARQKEILLQLVHTNCRHFIHEEAANALADFIARRYDVRLAIPLFREWLADSDDNVKRMGIFGFDVLRRKKDSTPEVKAEALKAIVEARRSH